ncbi:MAG: helix-turn-helix domain-containing protein [Bacilli bacterium]|nr:helix-turn-helix domain-containing protein [Bacilli bacterium]
MKLFKKEIGLTLVEYINSIRVYNSIMFLKNNNNNLTNIAIRSGFYSLEYFSETFKNITHMNPRLFKKYFYNKKDLTIEQIDSINNSIISLHEIYNKKDIYISKRKITNHYVKKLSIFK